MDLNIILNVIIGCFIYNIFLKAIGATILESLLKSKPVKEGVRQSFEEKLKERMEQKERSVPRMKNPPEPPKKGKDIIYH